MMEKPYTRKLSFVSELSYLVINQISPYIINFILEGKGVLNLNAWKSAVEKASAANPGSCLILKGFPGFRKWVNSGKPPRVREVDGSNWSGHDPEGAPFLEESFSVKTGPTCEVLLIHGDPLRIAFRAHHSVMDGRGVMTWMEDIFRALRSESVIGSDSCLTDYELMGSFQKKKRVPNPPECTAPTGNFEGKKPGYDWRRKKISGRFSKLLPQIVVLTAKEVWRHSDTIVRIGIPVDLRHRYKELRSTSNLTNVIFIEIPPGATPDEINNQISDQLENRNDCMLSKGDRSINFYPLWKLKKIVLKRIDELHTINRFFHSGLISNLGRLPLKQYEGGGFYSETCFIVPPGYGFIPVFLILTGVEDGVELTVTMPHTLANNNRLDTFIDRISKGVVSKH